MNDIMIQDLNGVSQHVEVVRYFQANNQNYLIYTMKEKDENGYIKLYIAKLTDATNGVKVEDEAEWNQVKDLIKVIVKEASVGPVSSVSDLNYQELTALKIISNRAFKLNEQVATILGANKKSFEVAEAPVAEPVAEAPDVEQPFEVAAAPVVEEPFEVATAPVVEEPKVETPTFEMSTQTEEKVMAKMSALEELLNGNVKDQPKVEEKPAEAVPVVEQPVANDKPSYEELEEKIKTYEEKLAKIKELL